MKISQILAIPVALITLSLPACQTHDNHPEEEQRKVVSTSPKMKDVTVTEQYVCQIHSKRTINVKALQAGYLEPILVKEGQTVTKGQVLFQVIPILYKAKWDAEVAEANLAGLELKYAQKLHEQKVISIQEVALYDAKLARAKAKAELGKAEFYFTQVRAAFDGIIDRLHEQDGSLVKEGDVLTTLSDNSLMWVYFNVPESRYIEYQKSSRQQKKDQRIELVLADGSRFPYASTALTIEAKFNNATGTGTFRADFPNSDSLLRHGMTGTIKIYRTLKNAIVIPQRATFQTLDKQYVYVVGKDDVVHQRGIVVQNEMENIYVIKSGLGVDDRIVYEGILQVRDGQKVESEFRPPDEVLAHLKYPAQ